MIRADGRPAGPTMHATHATSSVPEHAALAALAAARWRIGVSLTLAMTTVYIAFILLIAYGRSVMGTLIVPGLSVGIVLGVVVILTAWTLVITYVRWANTHYDHRVASIREGRAR